MIHSGVSNHFEGIPSPPGLPLRVLRALCGDSLALTRRGHPASCCNPVELLESRGIDGILESAAPLPCLPCPRVREGRAGHPPWPVRTARPGSVRGAEDGGSPSPAFGPAASGKHWFRSEQSEFRSRSPKPII